MDRQKLIKTVLWGGNSPAGRFALSQLLAYLWYDDDLGRLQARNYVCTQRHTHTTPDTQSPCLSRTYVQTTSAAVCWLNEQHAESVDPVLQPVSQVPARGGSRCLSEIVRNPPLHANKDSLFIVFIKQRQFCRGSFINPYEMSILKNGKSHIHRATVYSVILYILTNQHLISLF